MVNPFPCCFTMSYQLVALAWSVYPSSKNHNQFNHQHIPSLLCVILVRDDSYFVQPTFLTFHSMDLQSGCIIQDQSYVLKTKESKSLWWDPALHISARLDRNICICQPPLKYPSSSLLKWVHEQTAHIASTYHFVDILGLYSKHLISRSKKS